MVDKMVFQQGMFLAIFGTCLLVVFQQSTSYTVLHWHIHVVHLLHFFTSESHFCYLFT